MSESDNLLENFNTPGMYESSIDVVSSDRNLENAFEKLQQKLQTRKENEINEAVKEEEFLKNYTIKTAKEASNSIINNIESIIENSNSYEVLILIMKYGYIRKIPPYNKRFEVFSFEIPVICKSNYPFIPNKYFNLFNQEILTNLRLQLKPFKIYSKESDIYLTNKKNKKSKHISKPYFTCIIA